MTNILLLGFQAMQEEAAAARLAQNEGASSADSASSGYMSPHFLRPPSPDDLHMQPRRSSDSGVDMPGHEVSNYYCSFLRKYSVFQTCKIKRSKILKLAD